MKRPSVVSSLLKDKLFSEEWSGPVVGSISDLNVAEPGVGVVSSSEARKAINELKGTHALALLSPANVHNSGKESYVLMEDASGRCVVRRSFLLHLGLGKVTHGWQAEETIQTR